MTTPPEKNVCAFEQVPVGDEPGWSHVCACICWPFWRWSQWIGNPLLHPRWLCFCLSLDLGTFWFSSSSLNMERWTLGSLQNGSLIAFVFKLWDFCFVWNWTQLLKLFIDSITIWQGYWAPFPGSWERGPLATNYNIQYFPSSLTIKLFKIALLYCILLKPETSNHQDNKQLFIANYYLIYKINSL